MIRLIQKSGTRNVRWWTMDPEKLELDDCAAERTFDWPREGEGDELRDPSELDGDERLGGPKPED